MVTPLIASNDVLLLRLLAMKLCFISIILTIIHTAVATSGRSLVSDAQCIATERKICTLNITSDHRLLLARQTNSPKRQVSLSRSISEGSELLVHVDDHQLPASAQDNLRPILIQHPPSRQAKHVATRQVQVIAPESQQQRKCPTTSVPRSKFFASRKAQLLPPRYHSQGSGSTTPISRSKLLSFRRVQLLLPDFQNQERELNSCIPGRHRNRGRPRSKRERRRPKNGRYRARYNASRSLERSKNCGVSSFPRDCTGRGG